MDINVERSKGLRGEITPPPDKSVSHRAVMFSSLAKGRSRVKNFLRAGDTLSTVRVFRSLGVAMEEKGDELLIDGRGLGGLVEPTSVLDCGNSGTTMRLMAGILSGNPFFSVLAGDESLTRRPMKRVIEPLASMGANILGRQGNAYPPLAIAGGSLKPIKYEMPVASAQVKSSIILAGLFASGTTEVIEKEPSRDHTERMLPAFGARLSRDGLRVLVEGGHELHSSDTDVPNDFSSAAFFIAASLLVPGSEVISRSVCLNPTRTGMLDVLKRMGAKVEVRLNVTKGLHVDSYKDDMKLVLSKGDVSGEPVGDIISAYSNLKAARISGSIIPSLIDEFPVLCILGAYADGVTEIRDARELRVKESDRIAAMAKGLRSMGVEAEEFDDGIAIQGSAGKPLKPALIESFSDHRIAMAFAVAALAADGVTTISGAEAAGISFPGFFDELWRLGR